MDFYGKQNKEDQIKFYFELSQNDAVVKDRFVKIIKLALLHLKTSAGFISFFKDGNEYIKEKINVQSFKIPEAYSVRNFLKKNDEILIIHKKNATKEAQELAIFQHLSEIETIIILPIRWDYEEIIGTLTILNTESIQLDDDQIEFLKIITQRIHSIFDEKKKEDQILQFNKLYRHSSDLMGLAKLDGTILRTNPAFINELGANPDSEEDKNFFSFIYPPDLAKAKAGLNQLGKNVKSIQTTVRMVSRTGKIMAIEWLCSLHKESNDFFAVGRNITEIEARSQQLVESEKRFRVLFENSQTLMCIHDLNGNIVSVNKAGARFLSYKSNEVNKRNLSEFIPPERHIFLKEYLKKIAAMGRMKGAVKMTSKDGESKTFTFDNVLIKPESGEPYVIGNGVDWTDMLNLKEDLMRTKEMLEEATKMAKIGSWELNLQKKEMVWSKEMKRIFEMPFDENPSFDWQSTSFLDKQAIDELTVFYNNAINNRVAFEYQLPFVTKRGKKLWAKMTGAPIFSKNGTCTKIVGAFQDITKEKNTAEALKKAKLDAEQANNAKSEFLANMSHEIRTPLNGIIGFIDLLSRSNLNSEQKKYMDIVNESGQLLLGIVNDILDFSKIEARKVSLNVEKTDLFDLAFQVVNLISFQSNSKGLKVVTELDPKLKKYIWVDEFRLKQVLVNLLGNAVKFTQQGEIGLKISIIQQLNVNIQKIRFEVSDTGIGIEEKKMKQIFDAFMQSETSTTKRFGGTGLGLSISSQIVELFGSELKVKSSAGKGSNFYFDIIAKTEAVEIEGPTVIFENKTILVIDDKTTNFEFIKNILQQHAASFTHYKTSMEALQKLYDGERYDIILINWEMPILQGKEIYQIIKQNQHLREDEKTITLMYTSEKDSLFHSTLEDLTKDQIQQNPVKISELADAILTIIKEDKNKIADRSLQNSVSQPQGKRKILITEDNAVNMMLFKSLVSKILPHTKILEAGDGQTAIDIAVEQRPDIILMDIQLPGMNGMEACKEIRKKITDKHIPIIAVTAGNLKGEREKCLEAGMDDFLTKPITESILSKLLGKWVLEIEDMEMKKSHVDFNTIAAAAHNDLKFQKELIKLSKISMKESLTDLVLYFGQKDLDGLKSAGHKLKGTAGAMGFGELYEIATSFEGLEEFNETYLAELIEVTKTEMNIINDLITKKLNAIY